VLRRNIQVVFTVLLFLPQSLWSAANRPKLIVVVIVDQMRADYMQRFAPYEMRGLHFFAAEGANFVNAHYQHWPTETCVGHSVLLSGRNPVHTGIVANGWYDRDAGKVTYCLEDTNSPMIGDIGPAVSPKNVLGDNFSDWLRRFYPKTQVYSISLKDRGAITLGGHSPDGAFWFSTSSGRFVTSRYYSKELPAWVEEFNQKKIVDSYLGKQWELLLPSDTPLYHERVVSGQFPHAMPQKAGQELYEAVFASPFGDEVLEAFAETTVRENHLGQNTESQNPPDLLTISFSSNDGVGHEYGPNSREIADEQVRLDRTLGKFVEFVNQRLGKENVLWMLSGDHGSLPTPEAERELNHNLAAQRLPFSKAEKAITTQLNMIFHIHDEMHWFASRTGTMLYFDRKALDKHQISLEDARHALVTQVNNVPGIEKFYNPSQAPEALDWAGMFLKNSDFPTRSGDIYYLAKKWTCFSSEPTGTTHSDPWPYDTHVPFILAGWRIQPQQISASVHIVDVAPTLADLIGIRWPSDEKIDGKSRRYLVSKSTVQSHTPVHRGQKSQDQGSTSPPW
jgi:predicted AlkP superfamily pyrophosphatase or phosphodiesterase